MEDLMLLLPKIGWVAAITLYFIVNPDKFVKLFSPFVKLFGKKMDVISAEKEHEQNIEEAQVDAILQSNAVTTLQMVNTQQKLIDHILERDTNQLDHIKNDISSIHGILLRDEGVRTLHNIEISKTHVALIGLRDEIHNLLETVDGRKYS